MLKSPRNRRSRAKGAEAILVDFRPVSTVPVRSVLATKHLCDHQRFVDLEGVLLGGGPERMWSLQTHKLRFEIEEGWL